MSNLNSNPSVEQLENTISAYINSVYKDVPPTEDEFQEEADKMRTIMSAIIPVSDREYSEILKRLRQNRWTLGSLSMTEIMDINHGFPPNAPILIFSFGIATKGIWKR